MITELTLLLWNVHGIPLIGSNPQDIVKIIQKNPADYYCFQEVFSYRMFKAIVEEVKPEHYTWLKRGGILTLSRLPVIHSSEGSFNQTTYSRFDLLVRKGFNLVINEDMLMIANTHLDSGKDLPSSLVRASQLDQIMQWNRLFNGSVVLAGDFNFKEARHNDDYVLSKFLEYSKFRVAVRNGVDMILVRGDVHVKDSVRVYTNASDHDALWVRLRYENE